MHTGVFIFYNKNSGVVLYQQIKHFNLLIFFDKCKLLPPSLADLSAR